MPSVKLAARVDQIPTPATLAINTRVQALQASGADIINLSVGEPDFPTPARICAAAEQSGTTVTLDAEDHTLTDSTLRVHTELRRNWPLIATAIDEHLPPPHSVG